MDTISTGLMNFYGEVKACERDGSYYLCLDNHSSTGYVRITKAIYEALDRIGCGEMEIESW